MIVTMPLTMVLLDFWPLNRFKVEEGSKRTKPKKRQESRKQRLIYLLVIEKFPFYILSLFTGIMAVYAQHQEGAIRSLEEATFLLRLENAFIAYCKYVGLTFWPHDLAVLYPMQTSFPAWEIGFSSITFCLISVIAISTRQRFPYATFGWYWFVITLLPVIGILQFGVHSMADRYLYIPMVGILVIVAWGMGDLVKNLKYKGALLSVQAALFILVMAVLTFRQVNFWKNDFYLFGHALDVTEGNPICNNMLGVAFMEAGEIDLAIKQFGQAAAVNPKYTTALNNLGVAYYKKGLYDEAIAQFQESIRIDPDDQRTYLKLQQVMHKKLSQIK